MKLCGQTEDMYSEVDVDRMKLYEQSEVMREEMPYIM